MTALAAREFVIKEHVGILKLTDTFDIFDAQSQQKVALARETPGTFVTILRLLVNKQLLPTEVQVTEGDEKGPLLFSISRGLTFLRSKVVVCDDAGAQIGYFKSKLFSLGGGFWVYDVKDQQIAEVKGDWKGWNFKFLGPGGEELGLVSKKWAGIAKELFTSADTYFVSISEGMAANPVAKILLLAASLAIDIVYKERG